MHGTGVGLRAAHHLHVLNRPTHVAWFEAHTENYFADGGAHVECLMQVRAGHPIALHGVGLSLGSTDALDTGYLARIKRAVRRFEPALVSEHLSFSSAQGVFSNDLLPLPFTEEALHHVGARIRAVQHELGRQILIENISSYLTYECSALSEWEFLRGVAAESGCGLLLDLNNVYVNSCNHGFSAAEYLAGIPPYLVQEFHLAGHERIEIDGRPLLIDTHGAAVSAPVWNLYDAALARFGAKPTLIEWDSNLPAFEVLETEAREADRIRARHDAHAA